MKRPSLLITLPEGCEAFFRKRYVSTRNGTILTTCDPKGRHVGSGGGLIHALRNTFAPADESLLVINAGGESRRLPAYAAYGKVMLPVPLMPRSRGERIDATLLDLQRDMLQRIYWSLPEDVPYVVVSSGDVLLTLPDRLPDLPKADVVCLGLWGTIEMARRHGVFVCDRSDPSKLAYMLQKPDDDTLERAGARHTLLIDSGIWILSHRALDLLAQLVDRSTNGFYDLYTDMGAILGYDREPLVVDGKELTVAVWAVEEARFFHFGATDDLVRSAYTLQGFQQGKAKTNSYQWKKNPGVTMQNSVVDVALDSSNNDIWIENSFIPSGWRLTRRHMITGVPQNSGQLTLPEGTCIDLAFVGDGRRALRLYNFDDKFKGDTLSPELTFLKDSARAFFDVQGKAYPDEGDLYRLPLFPIGKGEGEWLTFLEAYLSQGSIDPKCVERYLSAEELTAQADMWGAEAQRVEFRHLSLPQMAKQHSTSGYFYTDLGVTALLHPYAPWRLDVSGSGAEVEMHRAMLGLQLKKVRREGYANELDEAYAALMRLVSTFEYELPTELTSTVHEDQIVWAKSPVRIDIAGGWTDTPPYCHYAGGHVVNLALNINGQDSLQVFIKRNKSDAIRLRSIDMGCDRIISDVEALTTINKSGDPFSIPKVAMLLCGLGEVSKSAPSWQTFMESIGGGFEITMLSALPAGSGLGVSSILAATTLGALSCYFGLGWSLDDIGGRTLVLEQWQGSCGGWQDQFGGIYHGIKSLKTEAGELQVPRVQWLPEHLFLRPDYAPCHMLLYTGITRRAKTVLGEIVERVMANDHDTLCLLDEMKRHAGKLSQAISQVDYDRYGALVARSWAFNKQLNPYSTTPEIDHICEMVADYTLGVKAPGAGGGGFIYMAAKDPDAAARIRLLLQDRAGELPPSARLVDMQPAQEGLTITLS